MSDETDSIARRATENASMGALIAASRVALVTAKIRDVVQLCEHLADVLRVASPLIEHEDTVARGRSLAYRWSSIVPGCSCLHRALATQLFLSAFRIRSRVVLGIRRRELLEGHAWLEVYLDDAATLLFVDDDDAYGVEIPVR